MALLGEFRGALTAFALVICGLLLLVSVNVGIPGQALLQSLRFHIAAALLVLVILLFVSGSWWRGVLFLFAFALSAGEGGLIVLRQQEARAAVAGQPSRPLLRMLSFNLLQSNSGNGQRIADFIINSGADLVLLMEAGPVKPFATQLATVYPYRSDCPPGQPCDMFLLSRTPLTDVHVGSLSDIWRNRLVTAKTVIGGTAITVVGAHKVKPYFDDFAEEEGWRLGHIIDNLDGPLVLAGDFNAAAWSLSVDQLNRRQHLIPGPIYPATWPVRSGPLGVPIDNMWTRPPLIISSIHSLDDAMGSNHRGIMAELSLAPPASPAPAAP